jgi:hypothetical protein
MSFKTPSYLATNTAVTLSWLSTMSLYPASVTKASSTSTIAFGPQAGQKVHKIGSAMGYKEEAAHTKATLCLSKNGFSIHASTKVNPLNGSV